VIEADTTDRVLRFQSPEKNQQSVCPSCSADGGDKVTLWLEATRRSGGVARKESEEEKGGSSRYVITMYLIVYWLSM
jgi:hypothetical protein